MHSETCTRVPESGRSLPTPSLISSDCLGWGVGEAPSCMLTHGVPQQVPDEGFRLVWNHEELPNCPLVDGAPPGRGLGRERPQQVSGEGFRLVWNHEELPNCPLVDGAPPGRGLGRERPQQVSGEGALWLKF
jgi:hypothetical protein